MPTENVVLDPESFKYYLKRRNKIRMEKIRLIQNRENTPGNGKIWKNKQTVFEEFKLETDKFPRNKKGFQNNKSMLIYKSRQTIMKNNHSYTFLRNSYNKEYDTDITQYIKAKDRLHSELLKFQL